jgi:hypothetical protein
MTSNARSFCILVLALGGLAGCSSKPQPKVASKPLDRIQGKVQYIMESGGAADAALNAGGTSSIYLWEGERRYRLFLKKPVEIVVGEQYVAEGVDAQKAVDEIGDPDQGKNGYPLESSCQRIVARAWANLPFDDNDATVSLVRARVKRYPARPLFLVTHLRRATAEEVSANSAESKKEPAADGEGTPEIPVPAEKQRGLLTAGPTVLPAPLWEPAGGTAHCKVVIDTAGKIASLETGAQLCEYVRWSEFQFKPTVKGGHPVRVDTEVEVRYEPRK